MIHRPPTPVRKLKAESNQASLTFGELAFMFYNGHYRSEVLVLPWLKRASMGMRA
jgi:hypothetical protein